jgi:flavin-dependent dehydrogenase
VIASLAGDGIAIALASGIAAAEAAAKGEPAPIFQRGFARRARRPIAIGELLRGSAERPLRREALMRLLRLAPRLPTLAARLTRIGS